MAQPRSVTNGVGQVAGMVRGAMLAAAVGFLVSACGSGGAKTGVMVVVDGRGLTAEQQASVRLIQVFIDGDGTLARITETFPVLGLKGGLYQTVYRPHVTSGFLAITGELDDALGLPISSSSTTVQVRSGNQVPAVLTFAYPDGGVDSTPADVAVPDAATPDLATPDVPADVGTDVATDLPVAGCGNGQLDPGETCDPVSTCPTACPQKACQMFALASAGTCQAACATAGTQTKCTNGDGCCPTGCTTVTDSDCVAACGNGVVEGAELCDGKCPTACPPLGCQLRALAGTAAACNAACTATGATQAACIAGDGCCPTGCTAATDADCAVTCGNGMVDTGELCDGNCPTSCPAMGCQLRALKGGAATCDATCVDGAKQTMCINKDGCCPMGCNSTNDSDCVQVCGNGVLEAGETCEVAPASALCSALTCDDRNACTADARAGADASCNVICSHTDITACSVAAKDGCCPAGCSAFTDSDCPITNDTCANALDISAGGDFAFSLVDAKQDLVPGVLATTGAQCPGVAANGAEVFFTFTLPTLTAAAAPAPGAVAPAAAAQPRHQAYLDIYDPAGKPVNASIEVYDGTNGCPVANTSPGLCDATNGQQQCSTANPWPLVTFTPAAGLKAYVAVRVVNGMPGRYKLRYQRVAGVCVGNGALAPQTDSSVPSAQPSTCNSLDLYGPTCASMAPVGGVNYFHLKCPAPGLTVTTCGGRTGSADTLVQIVRGNIDYNPTTQKCTVTGAGAPTVSCNDTNAACTSNSANAAVTNFGRGDRGIFAITVDAINKCSGIVDVNLSLVP